MGGGGPFTVTQLATNLETWLQANGAATASVGLDSSGRLNIDLNETSLNLAFRDQTATANGSSQADAEIGFDADGDGTIDETVSGFSNFFGLNDFFTDGLVRNIHESNVITSGFTSSGTTLRFVDGTASLPLDPGGGGDVTLVIPAGSTLEEIAALINTNVTNVSASVIADGSGYRLRISHDTGIDMAVTETGGGTLLSNLGMHLADTRSASQIEVRSDIIESPSLITRGVMQWNGDLGTAGEYFTSVGDDTAIQALAAQFDASNTFDSAGGLATLNVNFTQYAAAILSRNASMADNNSSQSETQSALSNSLKTKSDNIRGVNLDEEMADLIRFEQAYSAAARVINVIQSMFDALNQAVG
jgi:flagellar hook-associated protein 1 FlgK